MPSLLRQSSFFSHSSSRTCSHSSSSKPSSADDVSPSSLLSTRTDTKSSKDRPGAGGSSRTSAVLPNLMPLTIISTSNHSQPSKETLSKPRSIMRRVKEMRDKYPEHIVSIPVEDEQFDGFMNVPPDAFARLMALGYSCAVTRLVPDVVKGIRILVEWRISDLTLGAA